MIDAPKSNPTELVLRISKDGHVRCLYTEAIDLRKFGKLTTKRASTVQFNPHRQVWLVWEGTITSQKRRILYRHPYRETCLAWEREYFNERLGARDERRTSSPSSLVSNP